MGGNERNPGNQLSFKETLPALDKTKFKDPEYLALWRQFSSWLLVKYGNDFSKLAIIEDWIADYEVKHNGAFEGILFREEIRHIVKNGLVYPLPWNAARAKIAVPEKYESLNGLFFDLVPGLAEDGVTVGLASGVFDILHTGHLLFLKECRKHCQVLVVGVDENPLVTRAKGENRPYNDFSVRAGTLSELPEVNFICRVPELSVVTNPRLIPYITLFYSLGADQILEYLKGLPLNKAADPHWYQKIGPNLIFFVTEGDPALELKRAGAEFLGARFIQIPRFTNLSTTRIANHFGVNPSAYKPNRFGPDPWWIKQYQSLI